MAIRKRYLVLYLDFHNTKVPVSARLAVEEKTEGVEEPHNMYNQAVPLAEIERVSVGVARKYAVPTDNHKTVYVRDGRLAEEMFTCIRRPCRTIAKCHIQGQCVRRGAR